MTRSRATPGGAIICCPAALARLLFGELDLHCGEVDNAGMSEIIKTIARAFYNNRNYRFWAYQCAGWSGYSLVTFLSITLMDNNVSLPHLLHIALQAVLGILCSWPLRPIYRATFQKPLLERVVVSLLAIVVLSAAWTAMRIEAFASISGEPPLWHEFHYWYFGSLFVFLSWTGLYYGIHYYQLLIVEHQKVLEASALRDKEKLRRVEAESLAREAQLKMLRYQLNPHFLFNTLNAINAMVRLGERRQAGEMIQGLSSFLRHSLDQEELEDVTLEQELESLELYLDIEKARFQDRLTLVFSIDPAARQAVVPGLILQPIVENSMKYAISPMEEGGSVEIRARVAGDQLELEVLDSGPGVENLETDLERGIGLRNTVERLQTLYDSNYEFVVHNHESMGLQVRISIPLQMAAESDPARVA